jgi:hypothetical protein
MQSACATTRTPCRFRHLQKGKPVSKDSQYAKKREVTMSSDYTHRIIDDESVYREISNNVFEKEVDEMRPKAPRLAGVPFRKQWY